MSETEDQDVDVDDQDDHSSAVLEEFDELANEITVQKLENEIKDLKIHLGHINKLLDDVRDFTALATEREEVMQDMQTSDSATSSDDFENLERETDSLERRLAESNYLVIDQNGRGRARIHAERPEIQQAMAKCTELEKQVQRRRRELSYSLKLPLDLKAIEARIQMRRKHFEQLESKIDAGLAQNNSQQSKSSRKP